MHTFKVALVCAFAGAMMACNATALHAAPLPTSVAVMKSMVADPSAGDTGAGAVEVGGLALGNGPRNPRPLPSDTIGLTTTDIAGGTGAICKAEKPGYPSRVAALGPIALPAIQRLGAYGPVEGPQGSRQLSRHPEAEGDVDCEAKINAQRHASGVCSLGGVGKSCA